MKNTFIAVLIAGLLIIPVFFTGCRKLRNPTEIKNAQTATCTYTATPPASATTTPTAALINTATATVTATAGSSWILADLPVAITNAYNVHAEARGNSIYVAYQSGAGPGRQLNVKLFTEYGGWQDYRTNIAVSYGSGNPWYDMGWMSIYAAVVDSAGYVYVYYDSMYSGTWAELGVNPVAGPNCTEASVCSDFLNTGYESVYVMYIDGNDSNILKGKRIDTYLNIVYSWQDITIYPGPHRAYKVNDTGTFWISSYPSLNNWSYFLAFADADANTMVSSRFINGTALDFEYYGSDTVSTIGAPSYMNNMYMPFGFLTMAYSDAGLGGRAVVKIDNGSWIDIAAGPASPGQAKYNSLAYYNGIILAYADATAGDALVVKMENGASWDDLGFPAESIESCSAGVCQFSKYCPFVAYTTGAADGRKLKMQYYK